LISSTKLKFKLDLFLSGRSYF